MNLKGMAPSSLEFFKVYLPEFSAQHMCMPPAFVGLLNGTIPADATLRDSTGKCWKVRLEEDEKGLFMKKGWQEFVNDYSLRFGDFLVFNFDGKSQFDVKIFGTNGCLKKDVVCDELPKTWLQKGAGKIPEPTNNRKRKNFKSGSMSTNKLGGSSGVNYKRYTTVESLQESNVSKYASLVVPENPHFVSTMNSMSTVYIPKLMLQEYQITLNKIVKICDETGRMWPVHVNHTKDGRVLLAAGWNDFRSWHELGLKDKLIIELIVDCTKRCHQMQVQVLHKNYSAKVGANSA